MTGTDDTRDSFQRMMEDVDTGKVNFIIVKTLSRVFRNYADQGRYLEQVFSLKGVCFISTGNPFVDSLYMDWKSGDITKEDHHRMKARFDEKTLKLNEAITAIQDEISIVEKGVTSNDAYLAAFIQHGNISTLECGIIVELIDTIYVHENGQIIIDFAFADELKRVVAFIESNRLALTAVRNGTVS